MKMRRPPLPALTAGPAAGDLESAAAWADIAWRAAGLCLLAAAAAFMFNHFRPSPLAWGWRPPPPSAPVLNDLAAFRRALDRPETILVDARPALFHKMSHIPGAVSLPADEAAPEDLSAWKDALPPGAGIIIYCSDDLCQLADRLAKKLLALNLAPTIFSPGFAAWEEAGLPLETDGAAAP